VNRYKTCEWCHETKHMTTHHIKNRLGDKEEIVRYGRFIPVTIEVCRKCHNEIERDYILLGKVIETKEYVRENTLHGIEHNLPIRMEHMRRGNIGRRMTKHWLELKMSKVYRRYLHDKSCHKGLYNTQYLNKKRYRVTIMKLAIALNDIQ